MQVVLAAQVAAHGGPSVATDTVRVGPDDDVQAAVEAHAEGTVFLFSEGIYRGFTVTPKDGNAFVASVGTVLDGGGATPYAFQWSARRTPQDVTIRGFIVEHYDPPPQMGPILAGWHDGGPQTRGWVVSDCTVRFNSTGGIRLGHGMVVTGNRILSNGQIGITGIGNGAVIEDNHIAHNNPDGDFDFLWEAGGVKVVRSSNVTLRGNTVEENLGPGIWIDIESDRITVRDNDVVDNGGVGILYELSYGGEILENRVRGNGSAFHVWGHGAGILIQNSRDVLVRSNRLSGNARGIVAMQQDRGTGSRGSYQVLNVRVADNEVAMDEGFTGFVQDVGNRGLFTRDRVRFTGNRYALGPGTRYFAWNDRLLTEREWQDVDQDVGASFERKSGLP